MLFDCIVKFSATAASLENQNKDTRLISGQNAAWTTNFEKDKPF